MFKAFLKPDDVILGMDLSVEDIYLMNHLQILVVNGLIITFMGLMMRVTWIMMKYKTWQLKPKMIIAQASKLS